MFYNLLKKRDATHDKVYDWFYKKNFNAMKITDYYDYEKNLKLQE